MIGISAMFNTSDSQGYAQHWRLQGCRTQLPVADPPPLQGAVQITALCGLSSQGQLLPVWLGLSCAHGCMHMHVTQSFIFSLTFPLASSGLSSLSWQCNVDKLEAEEHSNETLLFHFSAFCWLFLLLQENASLVIRNICFCYSTKLISFRLQTRTWC